MFGRHPGRPAVSVPRMGLQNRCPCAGPRCPLPALCRDAHVKGGAEWEVVQGDWMAAGSGARQGGTALCPQAALTPSTAPPSTMPAWS